MTRHTQTATTSKHSDMTMYTFHSGRIGGAASGDGGIGDGGIGDGGNGDGGNGDGGNGDGGNGTGNGGAGIVDGVHMNHTSYVEPLWSQFTFLGTHHVGLDSPGNAIASQASTGHPCMFVSQTVLLYVTL